MSHRPFVGGRSTAAHRPYVGDQATSPKTTQDKANATLGMVLFSLILGFVIGLAVWGIFNASTWLTNLLWGQTQNLLDTTPLGSAWLPLVLCPLGGLIIGLFTTHFGGAPEPLEDVMEKVRITGGYHLEKPGAAIVGFLLPLLFGGSIGPEAGLTGIIAAACTRIGALLRAAGLRVVGLGSATISAVISAIFGAPLAGLVAASDDTDQSPAANGDAIAEPGTNKEATPDPSSYDFRRGPKLVLYLSAAVGAFGAILLFNRVFGVAGGLPRFEGITPDNVELFWVIPCFALGYAGAVIFSTGSLVFAKISKQWEDHTAIKPLIAGVALGVTALLLPDVMFPGEEQAFEVMGTWQQIGVAVLIATGLAKCLITPLCLHFGWQGGHFFPLIFSGISLGYGIAALSGIDPMFCVAITTATLVACVQRKALMAMGLLLLCFPGSSLIWMAGACLLGSVLPLPVPRKEHPQAP